VKFSVVLRGLAGVIGRRHELKPRTTSAPTWGELEPRFAGTLGAGLRVQFGDAVALRVDVSDTLSSTRVERVNGCSVGDLRALDERVRSGLDLNVEVSSGCSVASFETNDIAQALNLTRTPTASLAQLVQLGVGLSFSF
jgi:hypothetical protein